jgi:4-amino-4-deoxy-L-arabinose transferase-like glycosyltransferase
MLDADNVIRVEEPHPFDNGKYAAAAYGFLLLICLPLFFIGLGNPPLLDPDEPVYAATGRTMLLSGHFSGWWSPHYNGALWFDKPPMTYWLIGASMKLFGATALAARFPSALCALLLVAVTVYFTRKLWPRSPSAGFWAGLALATSLQTVVLARAAVTDMILAVLLTASVAALWNWLVDERKFGWLVGAGVLTGLATLTKGPVAIVLVGGTVLFYLLLTRQASRMLSPALWLSLAIAVIIALPWYMSMIHLHGSLFVQGFLEANNLTRYLSAEHPQTSSPFWFLPVLLGFIFPWTVPLVMSLWAGWRSVRAGDRGALLALIWIVWVFVFFSASQTKLLTYIYPLYPMAAALIGLWIDSNPSRKQRLICGIVFASIAGIIAIGLPGYVSRGNGLTAAKQVLEQIDIVFALSLGLAVLSISKPFERSTYRRLFTFVIPALCMAAFFAFVALSPLWKESLPDLSMPEVGEYIKANTPPGVPTVAVTLKKPSLVFYSSRNFIFVDDRKLAAALISSPPYPLCITKNLTSENIPAEIQTYIPKGRGKLVLHSFLKYVLIKYQPK